MAVIDLYSCATAAHKFCDMGCSVFPLRPREKRPMFSWDEYKERCATHDEITNWFEQTPGANLALVCGAISGIVVVDVDGEEGQQWFKGHGLKTNLFQYTSSKSKFHAFYRHPGAGIIVHPSVKAFHDQIDIRGDGSYVVLAPSIHPTGKQYSLNWVDDFDGTIASLPVLPEMFWANAPENQGKVPEVSTGAVELEQGGRNNGLTSLCGEWYARGLGQDDVLILAQGWNSKHCDPPLSDKEVSTIVGSMFKTHGRNEGLLNTDGVRGWVDRSAGCFNVSDIYRDMSVVFASDKAKVRASLDVMVKDGLIERVGNRNGSYRRRDVHVEDIDLHGDEGQPMDIWLPFDLHKTTFVYPGNVIVVSGETNSGKTSLLLDIAARNFKHHFRYLSSEMTPQELRGRLTAFGIEIPEWEAHCEFKQRSRNFADAIDPNAINVIDFLELSDEFYKANLYITQIFERLKNGIAIICLQKKKGELFGRGGEFTLEKARLGISLFSHGHIPSGVFGSAIVTKAKNIKRNNPQDKEVFYRLKHGHVYDMEPLSACPSIRRGLNFYTAKEKKQILGEIENYCHASQEPDIDYGDEF